MRCFTPQRGNPYRRVADGLRPKNQHGKQRHRRADAEADQCLPEPSISPAGKSLYVNQIHRQTPLVYHIFVVRGS